MSKFIGYFLIFFVCISCLMAQQATTNAPATEDLKDYVGKLSVLYQTIGIEQTPLSGSVLERIEILCKDVLRVYDELGVQECKKEYGKEKPASMIQSDTWASLDKIETELNNLYAIVGLQ